MEDFFAHEDLGIYIILILIVINSLIVMVVEHKQTKKTNEIYKLLLEAVNRNAQSIIDNKKETEINTESIADNKKATKINTESIANNKRQRS
jgi:magnesium-transporting ATPase (P-type)